MRQELVRQWLPHVEEAAQRLFRESGFRENLPDRLFEACQRPRRGLPPGRGHREVEADRAPILFDSQGLIADKVSQRLGSELVHIHSFHTTLRHLPHSVHIIRHGSPFRPKRRLVHENPAVADPTASDITVWSCYADGQQ